MEGARWALALAVYAGCAAPLINLSTVQPQAPPLPSTIPLEVKTSAVHVGDPLFIAGSVVRVAGLDQPLGHAIATAAVAWADAHRAERAGGWQLAVELIQADAERSGGRVLVTLGVRATLRARADNQYLAQTQTHCREGALVEARQAAPLFYACMMDLGESLAGWLGGVTP